jgi:hypothetical protein
MFLFTSVSIRKWICTCTVAKKEHFVCGWHSDDPSEVNYAPTLFDHKDNRKIKNEETTKDKEPIWICTCTVAKKSQIGGTFTFMYSEVWKVYSV